jgi:hypothetical protein
METESYHLNINYINDFYNNSLLNKLDSQWDISKLNIILDLIEFLLKCKEENKSNNIKSLEIILNNIDEETQKMLINL